MGLRCATFNGGVVLTPVGGKSVQFGQGKKEVRKSVLRGRKSVLENSLAVVAFGPEVKEFKVPLKYKGFADVVTSGSPMRFRREGKDSYFRCPCTGFGLRRKKRKTTYIKGDGVPAPLPGFTGSILVDQLRPKGNWLMQFLWDPSWTTEYTTRKGTVQQAIKQNYFLCREWRQSDRS